MWLSLLCGWRHQEQSSILEKCGEREADCGCGEQQRPIHNLDGQLDEINRRLGEEESLILGLSVVHFQGGIAIKRRSLTRSVSDIVQRTRDPARIGEERKGKPAGAALCFVSATG